MAKIKDLRPITPRTNGTRSLSAIKNIARHHSATTGGNWASFWRHWNGTLGWGTGGYHEIILRDGTVELCYDPNEITNGVGGQNSYIYNICLVGNGSFTAEQERTFDERVRYWLSRFNLPVSAVKGHNEFPGQSTNCPGINMNTVRARLSGGGSTASSGGSSGSVLVLKYGDTGADVRLFQDKLSRAGYAITVDGSFGPAMRATVQRFQRDHKLEVDGFLGPITQRKLDEVLIAARKATEGKTGNKAKEEPEEEDDYMAQQLPKTQQDDMRKLLAKAFKDGVFHADHTKKVDTMTRGQALDLLISYVSRTAK